MTALPSPTSWVVLRYEAVDSTQRVAADLVNRGAAHRTVVVARSQTAGYGRKGDHWHDRPGQSLLMTLILRPRAPETVTAYPMAVALATVWAIRDATGLEAIVKWPNDILVHDRKVAGILGDATWSGPQLAALRIGLGLNVGGTRRDFDAEGLTNATSLIAECGQVICLDLLLDAILERYLPLDDALAAGDAGPIIAAWRTAVATVGQGVVVTLADGRVLAGQAREVTPEGDLIVECDGSGVTIAVRAAEVVSLRHDGRLSAQYAS